MDRHKVKATNPRRVMAGLGTGVGCLLFAVFVSVAQAQGDGPAPVPEIAHGIPVDPDKGFVVREIESGLYWVGNGAYMAMFLVGPNGVAVVDAPPSLIDGLQAAIAETTDKPVTHMVYTHHHGDHIGGAGRFREDVTTIAHERTARALSRNMPCTDCIDVNNPRPEPGVTFTDEHTLKLGPERTLELAYKGPNHAPGNIFVHAPNQKTLMAVDIVYPGWVPFDLLSVSTNIPGLIEAHEQILDYKFDTFVGGHIGRTGNREDVKLAAEYIDDLQSKAIAALEDNPRSEIIPPLGREYGFEHSWWLTDQHTQAVTQQCTQAMEQAWKGRLGGVETFAREHCKRMQFSLRID